MLPHRVHNEIQVFGMTTPTHGEAKKFRSTSIGYHHSLTRRQSNEKRIVRKDIFDEIQRKLLDMEGFNGFLYLEFLSIIQKSNGILVQINGDVPKFKYYVGRGNNSNLITRIMQQR